MRRKSKPRRLRLNAKSQIDILSDTPVDMGDSEVWG
jgi:hypothetical protein